MSSKRQPVPSAKARAAAGEPKGSDSGSISTAAAAMRRVSEAASKASSPSVYETPLSRASSLSNSGPPRTSIQDSFQVVKSSQGVGLAFDRYPGAISRAPSTSGFEASPSRASPSSSGTFPRPALPGFSKAAKTSGGIDLDMRCSEDLSATEPVRGASGTAFTTSSKDPVTPPRAPIERVPESPRGSHGSKRDYSKALPMTPSKIRKLTTSYIMVIFTRTFTRENKEGNSVLTELYAAFRASDGGDVFLGVVSVWENNGYKSKLLQKVKDLPTFSVCVVSSMDLRSTATSLTKSSVKFLPTTAFTLSPEVSVVGSDFFFAFQRTRTTIEGLSKKFSGEPVLILARVASVECIEHPAMKGKLAVYDDSGVLVDVVVFAGQESVLPAAVGSALLIVGKMNIRSKVESTVTLTHFHLDLDRVDMPFNMFTVPRRQDEIQIDQMKSHSGSKVPLAELLQNRPPTGIEYVNACILIRRIDGNLVDFACGVKMCRRTIEPVDGVWFCNQCEKELDNSQVVLVCRPLADISVVGQDLLGCSVAAGNEQVLFDLTCDEIYDGAHVRDITDVKFRCTLGVSKLRIIIAKLSPVEA